MKEIMEKTAKMYGVTQEEVENEIFSALLDAMKNQDESNQKIWDTVAPFDENTPLFDMIGALAAIVVNSNDIT